MNSRKTLLGVASLTLLAAGSASAQVFATDPKGEWVGGGSVVTIGTDFTVGNVGVTVGSLGIFDKDGDGLERAEEVGIFRADKTLLGSVTLKSGTGSLFHDGTRWENLTTPIALNANTTYFLAWTVHPLKDSGVTLNIVKDPSEVTINPLFSLAGNGYLYTDTGVPGLNFPGQGERSVGLFAFGGNLALVPEPATVGLATALGLLGLAGWRRCRR
jgi:hypothetical protein